MSTPFEAVKVSENVYWVGVIDWELADFHGYSTPRGSTYNAYLILGEKVTLIDTVKHKYFGEMMARIQSVIDPKEIHTIISNHSEMDHTGALQMTINAVQPERVFASKKGVDAINEIFNGAVNVEAVTEGEPLDLGGGKNLHFIEAPLVHWPDSMFTYLDSDKILFSNDGFGMHLASAERFDDEVDPWILRHEAKTYFANILWPMAAKVGATMKKLDEFAHPIELIAPDHGPIWRSKMDDIMAWYREWVDGVTAKKVLVFYDTMWQSTAKMATAVAEGVKQSGAQVKVYPIAKSDRSEIATELLNAAAVIVGSPNLNGGVFPAVADIMTYLEGLKPKKQALLGGSFGSYGWSPVIGKKLSAWLEGIGAEVIEKPVQTKHVPADEALEECRILGKTIGEKVMG